MGESTRSPGVRGQKGRQKLRKALEVGLLERAEAQPPLNEAAAVAWKARRKARGSWAAFEALWDQGTPHGGFAMARWKIVGGQNGVLVRAEESLSSLELGRLASGSLVEELRRCGKRLHFKLLSGTGPPEGWISLQARAVCVLRWISLSGGAGQDLGGAVAAAWRAVGRPPLPQVLASACCASRLQPERSVGAKGKGPGAVALGALGGGVEGVAGSATSPAGTRAAWLRQATHGCK